MADAVVMVMTSVMMNRFTEYQVVTTNAVNAVQVLTLVPSQSTLVISLGALLELISYSFRSISLGFRFMANLSAGHVLGDLMMGVRYSLSESTTLLMILHATYESLVHMIQLMIFTALTLVYSELL